MLDTVSAKRMNLRDIETFLAAARHGTFTEAGLRLGLTQSAVSEQIR
ncbi:LysR family transcriptional regulator, partial [Ensifer sp. YR511]